jgi:hypothetical protein
MTVWALVALLVVVGRRGRYGEALAPRPVEPGCARRRGTSLDRVMSSPLPAGTIGLIIDRH